MHSLIVMMFSCCKNRTKIYPNGDEYYGEWKDGFRHGQGELLCKNLERYIGEWEQDLKNGHGVLTRHRQKYDGQFQNDLQHGRGITTFYAGEIKGDKLPVVATYEGDMYKGCLHGRGIVRFADSFSYAAEWNMNEKVVGAEVQVRAPTGEVYVGKWKHESCWGSYYYFHDVVLPNGDDLSEKNNVLVIKSAKKIGGNPAPGNSFPQQKRQQQQATRVSPATHTADSSRSVNTQAQINAAAEIQRAEELYQQQKLERIQREVEEEREEAYRQREIEREKQEKREREQYREQQAEKLKLAYREDNDQDINHYKYKLAELDGNGDCVIC